MLSPGSRGKGGRRWPGRDGGRGKRKLAEWRKQATHAVDDVTELAGEVIALQYRCRFRLTPAEAIYLFDQEMARTVIRYHATLGGFRFTPVFTVRVQAGCAETVRNIIGRLERP